MLERPVVATARRRSHAARPGGSGTAARRRCRRRPAAMGPLAVIAAIAALALAAATAGCDPSSPPPAAQQQAQVTPPPPPPPPAPESVPPGALPDPHKVAPPSADELERKRAEWREQQRMQEQTRAEMQAWQRSRRPESAGVVPHVGAVPRTETASDRLTLDMRAWYGRYSARAAAVSLALSQYGMAAGASAPDGQRLQIACRDLRAASAALLADSNALQAPLEEVSAPLLTAYTEIKATAESCLAYRREDQAAHFAAARQAMAQAGAALRPYHMTP